MCGIFLTNIRFPKHLLDKKMSFLHRRGPDFCKTVTAGGVFLGHTRLSIIDLSEKANQPFDYEHISLVYNGEIYNYLELRETLAKKGYRFKTQSDTEVLAAAYMEYGKHLPKKLNGMFAFAIYDKKQHVIFMARDRLGKKPLFYNHSKNGLQISSSLLSISTGTEMTIDQAGLTNFLKFKYISEPLTIYSEIKKLPSGYSALYDLQMNTLETEAFWTLEDCPTDTIHKQNFDPELFEQSIERAIELRTQADVPFCSLLSGGIDSSIISIIASRFSQKPFTTFSVGFEENEFDESEDAAIVSRFLGSTHYPITMRPSHLEALLADQIKAYEEPFADPSSLPSLLVFQLVKETGFKVVLSGDGADEIYLGYNRHKLLMQLAWIFDLNPAQKKYIAYFLARLPNRKLNNLAGLMQRENRVDVYSQLSQTQNHLLLADKTPTPDLLSRQNFESKSWLKTASLFDIDFYLRNNINTKIDRASMFHSLESRAPFQDYHLVEEALKIGHDLNFYQGKGKHLLRKYLRKIMPDYNFAKPKKGFSIPLANWLRGPLRPIIMEELSPKYLADIPLIDAPKCTRLIEAFFNGSNQGYSEIFKLLILSKWLREYY